MKKLAIIICSLFLGGLSVSAAKGFALKTTPSPYDLVFDDLATVWDEAMPLGNGDVGALVWQKDDHLRIALDRSDLWDVRPLSIYSGEQFNFDWIYKQVVNKDYQPVLRHYTIDHKKPGPTKIPGAALEIDVSKWGELKESRLFLHEAVHQLEWKNGVRMQLFVQATAPLGWFIVEQPKDDIHLELVPPLYQVASRSKTQDQSPSDLKVLGYPEGHLQQLDHKIVYQQEGWGGFRYEVAVKWAKKGKRIVGVWSVTSSEIQDKASDIVDNALHKGYKSYFADHLDWWRHFYEQSSITIPDAVLAKQYANEIYKMGSLARKDTYPIALQGVWTADNGRMAPWHGDYHHDLNTQLSYWPFYTSNHLEEEEGFVNTLWNQRDTHKRYTKQLFGTNGLNVPGICTLKGEPMGSWIQYTFSPTVSAWLGHHFYLHWQYSQDRDFLRDRAYPYLRDVATFLEEVSVMKNGKRTLPLSSSPEYLDNRREAWFLDMTNFDRALMRFAFMAAGEMATALQLPQEAAHWNQLMLQVPELLQDENGGLAIAPGHSYKQSHRHFSHLMAIHPLGLIDKSHGAAETQTIDRSLATLDKYGPHYWCGYSYSWLGSLKARAFDGEGAAAALRDFATNFCLRNTFHANGDQKNEGKSRFTYRPFTLEGNLAFAAGVQEMLIQSHTGVIKLFPAVPADWLNVSFRQLRTVGAFLVSASKVDGRMSRMTVLAEQGGLLQLELPDGCSFELKGRHQPVKNVNGILQIATKKGEKLDFVFHRI